MCIRDRYQRRVRGPNSPAMGCGCSALPAEREPWVLHCVEDPARPQMESVHQGDQGKNMVKIIAANKARRLSLSPPPTPEKVVLFEGSPGRHRELNRHSSVPQR
eukprot:TRINITY_DN862_c0_g2_i9.p3 TRINITY_DN862_c0_g2~~TRINITY_DN862_c0_g2_i9.p3  ORF type:complete len:104 (+),score=20.37 TRINITY_DN862_c0_g2_i9:138-449(+)